MLELDLEQDLTVLVGANGSGKSSILDAIRMGLRPLMGGPKSEVSDVRSGSDTARLTLKVQVPNDPKPLDVELVLDRKGDAGIDRQVSKRRGLRGQDRPLVLSYGVNRQVFDQTPGSTEGQAWTRQHAAHEWHQAAADFKQFFLWFKEAEDLENERVRDGQGELPELAAVRSAVQRLLGFSDLRVRRKFLPFTGKPVLTADKDGTVLPFDAFSEGERTTVALTADIARRLVLFDPATGLDGTAVVLLDELEQHLHPGWQRLLVRKLPEIFPNVQWVTTTHSPVVVSELEPRNLRVFKDIRLVNVAHGEGRDANAVLEDTFQTPPRPEHVRQDLERIADLLDDGDLDAAEQLLARLEAHLGEDPDLIYYRNILIRLRDGEREALP